MKHVRDWHHTKVRLTPVERVGEYFVKRDDLYVGPGGTIGGKARTCTALAKRALAAGAPGLVTAGSRSSPQVHIVAQIGRALGVPVRVHTPQGAPGPEVAAAVAAGARRIEHHPGYNTVIVSRAARDAAESRWGLIPFGMETSEAVRQTASQCVNIPPEVRRIVVPVGSGMSLAGVLSGTAVEFPNTRILGVIVGAAPYKRMTKYGPVMWQWRTDMVRSELKYHVEARDVMLGDIPLDPVYEAKCLPYLEPGDLLWIVGIRQSLVDPHVVCADSDCCH